MVKGRQRTMNKITIIVIGIIVILSILYIVSAGKNHKLEGEMYKQEQAYQDSLSVYEQQLIESNKLIREWETLSDSLDIVNLELDAKQLEIRERANNERKKRYEDLISSKHWVDNERDSFWAKEFAIKDTIILLPN